MAADDQDFDDFDVIIVGAGVSGLTAAYHFIKKDPSIRIAIFEAKDRIGGRTFGQELQGAKCREKWDLGGQWVGHCQPHIMDLLGELSLETYNEYTTGKKVMQFGDKVRTYKSDIPSLPIHALIDLHLFMSKAEQMIKLVDVEDPASSLVPPEWNNTTFEDLKNKMLWTKSARDTIDASLRCIFGTESSQISVLYFLVYAAAAGGLDPLISAKDRGAQGLKIKGGAWQVCHKLQEKVGEDKIRLSQPIARIIQSADSVIVHTLSGHEYQCQRLILALPPHQTAKIDICPSLPPEKLHVIHRMPAGNISKVVVTYQTCFWREAGFSGEAVTNGGKPIVENVDTGPLCIVFDATTATGNPAIVGFIGGDQHIQYSKLKPEDRKHAVLHSLSELFGARALDALDYAEKNWNVEPYSQGGPVSVGTPGMMTMIGPGLRKPCGRLHFAGTESATVWCGFINGAVQTGYRAANEVLYNLRPQAITASDLEGTAYDKTKRKPFRRSALSGTSVMKWAVAVGIMAGMALVARKHYQKVFPWKIVFL